MKRKPIPQFELPIANEPFALITEQGVDGDRIQAQRHQSEHDRKSAEQNQCDLILTSPPATNPE